MTFLAAPFVWQQTKRLMEKQIKRETFICAVRILAVGAFVQVITFALGLIL
jgi:1,4-dihydroxy-2-naphthoate polyprenyltransferase